MTHAGYNDNRRQHASIHAGASHDRIVPAGGRMKFELQKALDRGRKQHQVDTESFKNAIKLNLIEALEHGYVFMSICAIAWPNASRPMILDWLESNNCTGKWEDVGQVPYLNVVYKGYQV